MSRSKRTIFFVFMAITLLLGAIGTAQASPAVTSTVGIVDYLYLVDHHPDTTKANEALKAEQEQDKQQFAEKSAGLNEQDKQALDRQLGQQLEQKRLELLKPITATINAAIKEVADAKGLSVVVGKNTVIYGGIDITGDVLQKINGK